MYDTRMNKPTTTTYICSMCNNIKSEEEFVLPEIISVCEDCSDKHLIEDIDCSCSVCKRKLPKSYFTFYKTRFKKNGKRLRVNTNCKDCSSKESKFLREIKKENPPPPYRTECPQCNKICYEKTEDIPDGEIGTNGPWQCDHDHKTKEFRGYLCKRCNTGTGLIGDNEGYWRNANNRKTKGA